MLDELLGCIETLRERINKHGPSLKKHEYITRTQLIEPLLYALGWDVADPEQVTPELRTSDQSFAKADYALLQPDCKAVVLLEAKTLGHSLDHKERTQVLTYALETSTEYAGLTDGGRWELYEVFKKGKSLEERKILDVSIVNDPAHELAVQLLLLWRPNLSSGSPVPANPPLMQTTDSDAGPSPPKLYPPPDPQWVSLSEYNSLPQTPLPNSIMFWDGDVRPIQYWYELVYLTAEKLYKEGAFQVGDTPIKLTDYPQDPRSFRYSIHKEPKHSNGDEFTSPKTIGELPLYVETADNQNAHRKKTVNLIEMYGKDPSKVYLKL